MASLSINESDKNILRHLAGRVAELASRPSEDKKRKLWSEHNDLRTDYPVVFIDPENGWYEIICPDNLQTHSELARKWEFTLRKEIYWGESLKDDRVIAANFNVPYIYSNTGWGLDVDKIGGENLGAYKINVALKDYEEDFHKLRFPKIILDREASRHILELGCEIFDGILNVKQRNPWWWSLGLTNQYIHLRGLEEFMYDLLLEPEWVRKTVEFLFKGYMEMLDYLEAEGLLSQDFSAYVGSGGFGFTEQIPVKADGQKILTSDIWGFVESQEMVSVSPDMYGEFVFPFHKKIAERFALNCYACCEPYEPRWKYAKQIKNLRRVSCSPWSDRSKTSELLGKDYIASIKLSPTAIAVPQMDETVVRHEIRDALKGGSGCIMELIMKDNNTLGGNPNNAVRWVEIAREEIAKIYG